MRKGDFISVFVGGVAFAILAFVLAAIVISDEITLVGNILWVLGAVFICAAFSANVFVNEYVSASLFAVAFFVWSADAAIELDWLWLALSAGMALFHARRAFISYKMERNK
jgi:hypothetical protein